MFDQTVRFVGDKVAAVAADTEEIARKALSLISVEYEELPFYLDPEEAMKEDAYPIHQGGNIIMESNNSGGDVDGAIRDADHVFRHRYEMPAVNHCSLETHVSIAEYDADGKLTVWTPTQDAFGQRINLQRIFELPMSKIRVISPVMGGGFGGKEDMSVQHHAALMAWATGRPVKVKFSRQESLNIHTKRHAMEMDVTTACDENGKLLAMKATLISDCGAYASLGGPVLQRACTHCGGPTIASSQEKKAAASS